MNRLTRLCGLATGVVILSIIACSADTAWAQPASPTADPSVDLPTTITLEVPSASGTAAPTTITIEVRAIGAVQATELHVMSDADTSVPTVLRASVGNDSVASVGVDTRHPFNWSVPTTPTSDGCGPHPTAEPACAQPNLAQTPKPLGTPTLPPQPIAPEVAGQQATPQPAAAAPQATPHATPPLAPPAAPHAAPAAEEPTPAPPPAASAAPAAPAPLLYTVQPGDTLVGIAARLYGDPTAYARIAQANAGRPMPDGRTFQDPSRIQPGWPLLIPAPTEVVSDHAGARLYTVQPGDTLTSIAARFLGDPQRWPEVYALNQAGAGGSLAANPNLIQPGMQLHLPAPDLPQTDASAAPSASLAGGAG